MKIVLGISKLFLLSGLILIFFMAGYNVNTPVSNSFEVSVPQNTILYARVNPSDLLQNFILYSIFDTKDQALFDKFKDKLANSETDINNYGIDFKSNIEFFLLNNKKGINPFIKIRITNKSEFNKTFETLNYKFHDDFAYISFKNENIDSFFFQNDFRQITIEKDDFLTFLEFNSEGVYSKTYSRFFNNELRIFSEFVSESKTHKFLDPNKGLSVAFEISDEIKKLISNSFNITEKTFNIDYINLNYRGFSFKKIGNFIGVPDVDILLEFENETSIIEWSENILKYFEIPYLKFEDHFYIGDQKLNFKQLDSKSAIVGFNDEFIFSRKLVSPRFIEGSLGSLTMMKNEGLYAFVFALIPGFNQIKSMLNSFAPIETKTLNNHTVELKVESKDKKNFYQLLSETIKKLL